MKLSEDVYKIAWDVPYNGLYTEDQLRSVLKDPVANPAFKEAAKAKLAEIEEERNRIDFAALPDGTQVTRGGLTLGKRGGLWADYFTDEQMAKWHAEEPFTVVWQPKTLLDHLHDAGLSDSEIEEWAETTFLGSLGRLSLSRLCRAALDLG